MSIPILYYLNRKGLVKKEYIYGFFKILSNLGGCQMLKKLMSVFFVFIFLLVLVFANDSEAETNGPVTMLETDVSPVIVNGTTLVPIKFIADWLGYSVDWHEQEQTVTIGSLQLYEYESRDVLAYPMSIKLNEMEASVRGKNVELNVPAISYNGRTMVPLRFVAESFGIEVEWNNENRTIILNNNGIKSSLYVPEQSVDETEKLKKIADPIIALHEFKKEALDGPSYEQLLKGSKNDLYKPVSFRGKVFQAQEFSDGSTLLLVDVGYSYFTSSDLQLIAVFYDYPVKIVENQIVIIYGEILEPYSYSTRGGYINTVPAIKLVTYENLSD